jgi:hypothetical protein
MTSTWRGSPRRNRSGCKAAQQDRQERSGTDEQGRGGGVPKEWVKGLADWVVTRFDKAAATGD